MLKVVMHVPIGGTTVRLVMVDADGNLAWATVDPAVLDNMPPDDAALRFLTPALAALRLHVKDGA